MSSKKNPSAPIDTTGETVTETADVPETDADIEVSVDDAPQTASMVNAGSGGGGGAALVRAAPFDEKPFDLAISEAGDKLEALVDTHPELAAKIEELAAYAVTHIEGMEESNGAVVPNARMRQAMTKEETVPANCKIGMYYTAQGDVLGNDVKLVFLHGHKTRVRFLKGQDTPDCTSLDGKVGSRWGDCSVCPYGRWEEGAKSECSNGHSYTAVTEDFTKVYKFQFVKTGARAGKKIPTIAQIKGKLYGSVVRLYTEKDKNADGNEYFVPKVQASGTLVQGAHLDLAQALSALVKAQYVKAIAQRDARTIVATPPQGAGAAPGEGFQGQF